MAEVALQAPIAKVYPGMNILRLWGEQGADHVLSTADTTPFPNRS